MFRLNEKRIVIFDACIISLSKFKISFFFFTKKKDGFSEYDKLARFHTFISVNLRKDINYYIYFFIIVILI